MTNPNDVATEVIALITSARGDGDAAELLKLALDALPINDGETLKEYVTREATLVSVLAGFAGALATALDSIAPGRVDPMFQRLALKYASEGGEQ
jgi:hypothetical protein